MKRNLFACFVYSMLFAPFGNAVELIGKAVSKSTVNVVSEINGVIARPNVQTGAIVTRGQLLASIDEQLFELEVRKRKANVALVKADLDIRQSVYLRYQELRSRKSLSQNELDIAKADFHAAEANLSLAKIDLEKARLDLSNTRVRSPIEGYVVSRSVEDGSWVNQGDMLYQLTNIDELSIQLLASEFDLPGLSVGQPVQLWLEARPEQRLNAQINRIGVELDPATLAYIVEVEIENKQHLFKPGMSIHATTEFDKNIDFGSVTNQ